MIHHSIRLVAIDFLSSSYVIWQISAFPPCFSSLWMASCQPLFHWRQRLIRLQWTVHGPTEGPDTSLMSCVKSLKHFSVFLKHMTFRYWTSAVDQFLSFPHLPLTSFLRFFWRFSAYHAKIRLPSFQLIALGIYLVSVKVLIHVFNTMLSLGLMWLSY